MRGQKLNNSRLNVRLIRDQIVKIDTLTSGNLLFAINIDNALKHREARTKSRFIGRFHSQRFNQPREQPAAIKPLLIKPLIQETPLLVR